MRAKRMRYRPIRTYKMISTRAEDDGREIATIRWRFPFLRREFEVKSIHGKYRIDNRDEGNLLFTLVKNGETVATISRGNESRYDDVKLECNASEDENFMHSLVDILKEILYHRV